MGLTPEYLQKIRDCSGCQDYHREELLKEIDNLRDRLSCPQEYWECAKEIRTLTKERDENKLLYDSACQQLGTRIHELEEEKSGLYSDLLGQEHRLGSRIEILEKENEIFKQAMQLAQSDVSIKHKYKADVLERSVEKLLKENEILKEALEKIADPRKRDHKEPDEYTQIGCLMHIANEAVINSNGENHE